MRMLRPLVIATVIVTGVYVYTSHRSGNAFSPAGWITRPQHLELTQAAGPETLSPQEQTNIDVYRRVVPSVVNVTSRTVQYDFFYGVVPAEGQGSGFIIDKEGHILTNYHVIANAQRLEVTLHDRKRYGARVVGFDRSHDLAVIQIPEHDLAPVTLGDSSHLQVGMNVFAIGNPFGLNGTMTRGIISSIRSVRTQTGDIDNAIQTDAAINPGNSGGPLLNSRGDVIGINTMIATGGVEQSAGIGFAIPINSARAALNDLVQFGHIRRPAVGVRTLPITPELAQQMGLAADYGLLIVQVVPGGPADHAGLHGGNQRAYLGNTPITVGGDLLIAIDGQTVETQQDLARIMDQHKAGDTVTATVIRGKKKMDVKITLGEAQQQA
ncbi:MAG: trypsin-like peptidase domain-containing protein [Acidobacteria bacterium]|nr:trypsin-like peptidase domain-containing protein [Acidobacteriota bacterium]